MTVTGMFLVIIGAIGLAFYNIWAKKFIGTEGWKKLPGTVSGLVMGCAGLALLLFSVISPEPITKHGWLAPVVATGLLNIGFQYLAMKARSLEDISLVNPILATTPAVLIVTSMVILGEYPSALGWLGIQAIVAGTYMLNIQELLQKRRAAGYTPRWTDWLAPFAALSKSSGVRCAFAAAMFAAVSINYDALVAKRTNVFFGGGLVFIIAGVGSILIAAFTKEYGGNGRVIPPIPWKTLAGTVCFFFVGVSFSSFAFRYGLASYIGTLKRLQIPVVVILAWWLLGEKLNIQERLVGGIIIAIGAGLIGASR